MKIAFENLRDSIIRYQENFEYLLYALNTYITYTIPKKKKNSLIFLNTAY